MSNNNKKDETKKKGNILTNSSILYIKSKSLPTRKKLEFTATNVP